MTTNGLLMISSFAAALAASASAQTISTAEPVKHRHQLSPALQKKVADRAAALRAHAADAVGPLFDQTSKSWTIETADCPLAKAQLKGTGMKGHTVWVAQNDDGTFHVQIRTEASGTAVDANGNKYIWIDSEVANVDTPDPTADNPIVTGYGPGTFQLIPTTSGATGYTVVGVIQADTPTPLSGVVPIATSAPLACDPL
jgi:hypothetical protein